MLQIGSILDRKYKILSEIGHGGMSVVYLAINERAGKTWAVKEVRKEGVVDEQANLAGLVAETNLLKELHHKNLPSIIDVIDTDDSFIIVMDYIEGKDLKKILDTEGAQDPEAVRKWGIQVCDVLGYLHSQNPPIIYRDMKPANLMLKPADSAEDGIGDISLIDFGTARRYKYQSQADDTKPLGTIGYAAPEQYGGHGETDARTDIFNTGATLFHLLTGISPADPPFYGVTLLRNVDPAYEGSGWEYVINKCCQQKREDRYQSCDELRYDLEHLDELSRGETAKRKRRWAGFLASIALCLVGAIGMFAFNFLKNSQTEASYGALLSEATAESDISAAKTLYKNAMSIDPGAAEAYTALINAISSDGVLTDEEIVALNECLYEKYGGARSNLDYLQSRNPKAYADTMYQSGIMYFLMHKNTESDMRKAATSFFEPILDSDELNAQQRNLVMYLYNIGTSYRALSSGKINYLGDYTYFDLWSDLCAMVEGEITEKVGSPQFAIALYNQMALQIYNNYAHFNEYGVSQSAMEEQLDLIENGLNNLSAVGQLLNAKQSALNMVEDARRAVSTYFDRRG